MEDDRELREPTAEEARWMRRARRLLKERPRSLWLYVSADGGDMRAGPEIPQEIRDLPHGGPDSIGLCISLPQAIRLAGGDFGPVGPGFRVYIVT